MKDPVRIVLMTAPDPEVAERLAAALVDARLAACVNLLPGVTSIYRWEGEVERAGEVLLVLKTTASRFPAMMERAVDLHPYDVPEVLALPVGEGHAPYLQWVADETTSSAGSSDIRSPAPSSDTTSSAVPPEPASAADPESSHG